MGAHANYTNYYVPFYPENPDVPQSNVTAIDATASTVRGTLLKLKCSVDASPPHTRLDWARNGESFLPGKRYLMSPDNLMLTINQLATTDDGLYKCTAKNARGIGTCVQDFALTVVCKSVSNALCLCNFCLMCL